MLMCVGVVKVLPLDGSSDYIKLLFTGTPDASTTPPPRNSNLATETER